MYFYIRICECENDITTNHKFNEVNKNSVYILATKIIWMLHMNHKKAHKKYRGQQSFCIPSYAEILSAAGFVCFA